jgi:hypothetical protein
MVAPRWIARPEAALGFEVCRVEHHDLMVDVHRPSRACVTSSQNDSGRRFWTGSVIPILKRVPRAS